MACFPKVNGTIHIGFLKGHNWYKKDTWSSDHSHIRHTAEEFLLSSTKVKAKYVQFLFSHGCRTGNKQATVRQDCISLG